MGRWTLKVPKGTVIWANLFSGITGSGLKSFFEFQPSKIRAKNIWRRPVGIVWRWP
jgi:hypothetical protein